MRTRPKLINGQTTLCGIEVWPGVIGNVSSNGLLPFLIQLALGRAYRNITGLPWSMCPTHTFMIVERDDQYWIADVVSPRSKLTALANYEDDIAAGRRWNLQLFQPARCARHQQERAAAWWVANRLGLPYDWPAYPRLILKALVGDILPCAAGLEWADWCTESIMRAYRDGTNFDVLGNSNPTPLTVVKRWRERSLTEVLA
jgi:hypothetical protein